MNAITWRLIFFVAALYYVYKKNNILIVPVLPNDNVIHLLIVCIVRSNIP